jgi:hypothetical protein
MSTPQHFPIARRVFATLAVVSLLTGCKKAVTAVVEADALTVVQGNYQSVQAGKELPTPIILRATDKSGTGSAAMAALPVTLVVAEGGGSVAPASGVTDAKGEYTAKWTLGPVFSGNKLLAKVPGLDAVKLEAVGILPSDIIVAQGNMQTAKVGASLATSIVVRIVGGGNVPMSGITVLFQVTGGGGSISPQTVISNNLGEVTTKWTLGPGVGTQTASISASVLSPVTLIATATP